MKLVICCISPRYYIESPWLNGREMSSCRAKIATYAMYRDTRWWYSLVLRKASYTGVHCFNLECNTAMNVLVYYTLPGVRVIHSSQILNTVSTAEEATGPQLCSKRDEQELRGLNFLSRFPRGLVVKVLVCHPIVKGSIPTLAMIFLHGSHKCSSFSRERERK
jgi:hypothetical protein